MLRCEQGRVGLGAHLQGVASVDEDRRRVGKHDRGSGGAGEAGQPGEAFGRGRQVFALVLVGMGHDEAGEARFCQFLAQPRQSVGEAGLARRRGQHVVHGSLVEVAAPPFNGAGGRLPGGRVAHLCALQQNYDAPQ